MLLWFAQVLNRGLSENKNSKQNIVSSGNDLIQIDDKPLAELSNVYLQLNELTKWGWDKFTFCGRHFANTISKCIFLYQKFWIQSKLFHWGFFFRFQLTLNLGSDNGLAPNRRQAIIWTNGDLVCWRIYVSIGLDALYVSYWGVCLNM